MELLGSIKSKVIKVKLVITDLEITEIILVHCNMSTTIISKIQESFIQLFLINHLVSYWIFHQILKIYIEIWFTDQNSKPLEIKDKLKISLVIN